MRRINQSSYLVGVAPSLFLVTLLMSRMSFGHIETPARSPQTGQQATAHPENLTVDQWIERSRQFHGHLGAWLVCGLRLGEIGLTRLRAPKYFGLTVEVHCPNQPPVSCLLDGLQLSTGCTMGKQNIKLAPTKAKELVRVKFTRRDGATTMLVLNPKALEQFRVWNATLSEEEVFKRVWRMPESALLAESR